MGEKRRGKPASGFELRREERLPSLLRMLRDGPHGEADSEGEDKGGRVESSQATHEAVGVFVLEFQRVFTEHLPSVCITGLGERLVRKGTSLQREHADA